jgi:hypothetical protein
VSPSKVSLPQGPKTVITPGSVFQKQANKPWYRKSEPVKGMQAIDRKINPYFSAKAVDEATRQAAVAQYHGLEAVWEHPTQEAVDAANRFMRTNNITGITVRLSK